MVEGPGCKIKGEKIRSKLLGQTVRNVKGNAVNREIKPTKGVTSSKFDILIGKKLEDVQTLGKELFMYFGDICLRVHFLMAGSFRVNNQKLDHDAGGDADTPSLEVGFNKDLLTFNKSAVDIRASSSCRERYEELHEVDICSPVFNQKRAVSSIMEQKGRLLCDILLDQTLLPGVGNIIKNEAFFDSGIRPSSTVEELTQDHVSHLVKMTRDFTMIFYKCRKTGTNLNKFMKIYGKRKCTQCGEKVTVCKIGEDSQRLTHFCPFCQDNDLTKRKLPSKNSLLDWFQSNKKSDNTEKKSSVETTTSDWPCEACTFLNKASFLSCEICQTERPPQIKEDLTNSCNENSRANQVSTAMHTHTSSKNVNPTIQRSVAPSQISTKSVKRKSEATPESTRAFKQPKTESHSQQRTDDFPQSVSATPCKIPPCPGHGKKCSLTEVHKKGPNLGKFFFSCSMRPVNKQCKFFQWADECFPICEGHGKPCTLRTVFKEGPNNGRKFFTCRLPKKKQCKYFEWAVGFD